MRSVWVPVAEKPAVRDGRRAACWMRRRARASSTLAAAERRSGLEARAFSMRRWRVGSPNRAHHLERSSGGSGALTAEACWYAGGMSMLEAGRGREEQDARRTAAAGSWRRRERSGDIRENGAEARP